MPIFILFIYFHTYLFSIAAAPQFTLCVNAPFKCMSF